MYRFFLCGILVFSASLLGNWFSKKLYRRTKYLQSMLEGISRMKVKVCFLNLDIYRAVEESFSDILVYNSTTEILDDISIESFWSDAIDSIPKSSGLKSADIELLKGFGKNLGVTDVEGQINNCELYSELVSERLKISKEEETSKSRLYRILGFSSGFAITLLVV